MTYLIIGAGQAGAWAARTLREQGHTGTLVLCGAEPQPPYERPPLSKAVLAGDGTQEHTPLLDHAEMDRLGIRFLSDTNATQIDRQAHRVHCADGRQLDYTRLLLATGGRPYRPPIPGLTSPHVYVLRSLADALALRQALRTGSRVAVIGGGWIGLETAATARTLGCRVTVLEAGARLCARSVMPPVSDELLRMHAEAGVDVRLNASVSALHPGDSDAALQILLADGTCLAVDVLVLGAGLQANDELARAAGLACVPGGILVNSQCRSSDPDIYAAGDVAVRWDTRLKAHLRLESWQNAQDQGVAAARAMLGQAVDYQPLPLGWSEQYGHMIQTAGYPDLAAQTLVRTPAQGGTLYLGLDATDSVTAAVGVNAGRAFRQARQWVAQRVRIQDI